MSNTPTPDAFWDRQRQRLAAIREIYRERGIIVLSPKALSLWKHREELEREVDALRDKSEDALRNLQQKDIEFLEERFEDDLRRSRKGA